MANVKSLPEIQDDVSQLALTIGASTRILPSFGKTTDCARPHIEVDSWGYHYITLERGEELKRITTSDYDDLLYHIFESVTFNLACDHELSNRIENQDCRRMVFQHQIELLSEISDTWAERRLKEHSKILQQHPFDDNAGIRVELSKQVGWTRACEKFPLPIRMD